MNAVDAKFEPLAAVPSARGQLGFWMCTALVVGNTIGIGIFLQPASLAPYGFNAFIAWGITVLGCVALALVFAMLARSLAQADGPFDYMVVGASREVAQEGIRINAVTPGVIDTDIQPPGRIERVTPMSRYRC